MFTTFHSLDSADKQDQLKKTQPVQNLPLKIKFSHLPFFLNKIRQSYTRLRLEKFDFSLVFPVTNL